MQFTLIHWLSFQFGWLWVINVKRMILIS